MTVLLVQTFLLLLGAFLLGASLACFLRRAFSGRHEEFEAIPGSSAAVTGAVPAAAVSAAASSLENDRFGRALAGAQVPPVFQGPITGPVVEVQPLPEASPVPPVPAAQADAPPAAEKPAPAPEPKPAGPTYTEIAVATAAAAVAAAAAAKAKAEQDAAEKKAKAEAEAAKTPPPAAPEAPPAAPPPPAPAPASETSETAHAPLMQGDDLTRIHAIDAALKDRLYRLGVRSFAAIAAWTPEDLRSLSQSLGFQQRILDENWIEQAKILAKGGDPAGAQLPAKKPAPEVIVPVGADRLHRIIGIDPASEAQLYANGVTRLVQIAGWSPEDAGRYEGLLGLQEGRIAGEGWVDQARFLTRGDAGTPAPNQAPAASLAPSSIPAVKATMVTVAERPPAPAS
jgi:predicted flap endonuclease-1-like 5' DNA nuclease